MNSWIWLRSVGKPAAALPFIAAYNYIWIFNFEILLEADANYLFGHFPIFSSRRSGVELSTFSTIPKLSILPEAPEPERKRVTDPGLEYAASMNPVSGSGHRPRGPHATTGPSESPMPQMGWPPGAGLARGKLLNQNIEKVSLADWPSDIHSWRALQREYAEDVFGNSGKARWLVPYYRHPTVEPGAGQ